MNRRLLPVFVLVIMLAFAGPLTAAERTAGMDTPYGFDPRTPSAGAMAFDAIVVRPLGFVATAGGMALFMVSLPFSIWGDNTSQAGQALVGEPGRFTFMRPLGEFDTAYDDFD